MKFKKMLGAVAAAAALASGAAHAAPVNVLGVTWDPASFFDFSSNSNLVENVVTTAGGELSGYGTITAINSSANFCSGCFLSYTFSGYLLDADYLPNPAFSFSGGMFEFYVTAVEPVFTNPGSFSSGTPWLSLVGANPTGAGPTLTGNITNFAELSGQGLGYLNVVGGVAAPYFDTNTRAGGTDFFFTSEFKPINDTLTPITGTNKTHIGSATIRGDSRAVPEPGALALLGLGLAGLAAVRRNKKAA